MKFGILANMLSIIFKDQALVEKAATSSLDQSRKCSGLSKVSDVEGLLLWFKQARAINPPVSGPITIEKE